MAWICSCKSPGGRPGLRPGKRWILSRTPSRRIAHARHLLAAPRALPGGPRLTSGSVALHHGAVISAYLQASWEEFPFRVHTRTARSRDVSFATLIVQSMAPGPTPDAEGMVGSDGSRHDGRRSESTTP
jgi:hypothetical protein